ncbi:MAG: hypothetical protein KGI00_01710 [Candidatus Micrarchaeota archaeon]|nr:hypothetical protein [Candidatus Micrarchaeota archaeon]MDE1824175.1 hypothetical protein [Candidatus Micrarchaeota archaeon]MDE1849424.1 hypothetical protein [Candidatus Micrarchaeota archaeon]
MAQFDISGAGRGKVYVSLAMRALRRNDVGEAIRLLKDADREYQRFAERLKTEARETLRGRMPDIFNMRKRASGKLDKKAGIYDEKAWNVAQLAYGLEIVHKGEKAVSVLDKEHFEAFRGDAERAKRIIERLRAPDDGQ